MTEWLHFHFSLSCTGEGNGNPLQCSCLENPRDGGVWWAATYGVAQSRTRLKQLSSSSRTSSPWSESHFQHLLALRPWESHWKFSQENYCDIWLQSRFKYYNILNNPPTYLLKFHFLLGLRLIFFSTSNFCAIKFNIEAQREKIFYHKYKICISADFEKIYFIYNKNYIAWSLWGSKK